MMYKYTLLQTGIVRNSSYYQKLKMTQKKQTKQGNTYNRRVRDLLVGNRFDRYRHSVHVDKLIIWILRIRLCH